jgi:rhodanese-related sulfurtransferase
MKRFVFILNLFLIMFPGYNCAESPVKITPQLEKVDILHQGKPFTIMRNQDNFNLMNPDFTLTSRPCPPFCLQPMTLSTGVETIGELEVIDYLKKIKEGDQSILVIDSRTPDWVQKGTIPGTINIPWDQLSTSVGGADPLTVKEYLAKFGAQELEGLWDFSQAKTLILFCNGVWCGQSPLNIKTLLKYGYPPPKLKWYRGGMQAWETVGLNVIKP